MKLNKVTNVLLRQSICEIEYMKFHPPDLAIVNDQSKEVNLFTINSFILEKYSDQLYSVTHLIFYVLLFDQFRHEATDF